MAEHAPLRSRSGGRWRVVAPSTPSPGPWYSPAQLPEREHHASSELSGVFHVCLPLSYELLSTGRFSRSSVLLLVDPACCSSLSRHGEGVSPAWHRQNIARAFRIELHLLTQVVQMRFDQAAISLLGVSPHALADDARRQHLPWMRHQHMEQAALGGRHLHFALTVK